MSVSATGLVAYRIYGDGQRSLTWFDRSGRVQGTVGGPDASLVDARVSPDGQRVVVARSVRSNLDVWLVDGARTSRVTSRCG